MGGGEENRAKNGLEEEAGGVGIGGDGGGVQRRGREEGEIVGGDVAEGRKRQIESIGVESRFFSVCSCLRYIGNRRNGQQMRQ